MNEYEALARLEAARVGHLATVTPEGRPHVVPLVFAVHGRVLYFAVDRKPKRTQRLARLRNLRATPFGEIVVDGYDDGDWSRLWWVRVSGPAREVQGEERERALGLLGDKYPQHRAEPPLGPVVAVDIERVVAWSAA